MEVHDTQLHGVRRIVPKVFADHRGRYVELFDTEKYRAACAGLQFVQDDLSVSHERVLRGLFEEFADSKSVTQQFPRIAYRDALRKYGTDKPDLRNPIEMVEVTDIFRESGFKIFAGAIAANPKVEVWAIPAPTGSEPGATLRDACWPGNPAASPAPPPAGSSRVRIARTLRSRCRASGSASSAPACRPLAPRCVP